MILNQSLTCFFKFTVNWLACFVENILVYCISKKFPTEISISEIPLSKRDLNMPCRFRPVLSSGGMPIWIISYIEKDFEDI